MKHHATIERREFLKAGTATVAGTLLAPATLGQALAGDTKSVRIGSVGVGGRGTALLRTLLRMKGVEVPAVCDTNPAAATKAQQMVVSSGWKEPTLYTKGEEDFRRLMDRADLDAVIIATPWEWHTPMAVCAMKAGKYAGVEVPAAITLDECWELVKTSEATGVPCMMLENWSFRRDNLAVLKMIRAGLFGEIVHCHCAHSHNCMHWYFDAQGRPRWSGDHLLRRNADQYPTHSLGPVMSWMDINCGDRLDYVVSMASRSLGIKDQLERKHGRDHAPAKLPYKQGDIVTTMVKTARGNTIVIAMDMQLPRPYDNRWQIQGTRGLYNEQRDAVFLADSPGKAENWEPFGPYQEKYDHAMCKDAPGAIQGGSHGGTDVIELREFVAAVRAKTQTPIDVYDSVTMSVIFPLSERSIAAGSAPVKCPDFTGGRWKTTKPKFAVES
ncbi:MAG: Gfo/Idh/MocA family oxidoreductase [Verrucomicrobia bacterium]|nr:Gfo/Idh/MocA family oxidoreductase [Verrucomicrobiota bacterium]